MAGSVRTGELNDALPQIQILIKTGCQVVSALGN